MLKKLFASVSAFAVLFASVAPSLVTAAPVVTDPELIDAVTWAYDTGLTKYSDANTFMPFNNLTREQAAKFASEFAETVLNIEADSTRTTVCEYKDASIMDATLVDSVTKACQQSIMMGYQGNFMPKQLLTRGQFATMVSRMLGGIDAMSTEQAHFDYLKDLGIMNVANLTSTITRGDATLMLYRTANGSSSDLCAIDPNLPGCSTNPTTPIVKKGDLNVALNPASPVNYSSVPKDAVVKFATVDFTAGSSDITLNTISLVRKWLGVVGDIDRVYFEKDGVRVSTKAAVSSDNKATVSFSSPIVVTAGKTVSLDLMVSLKAIAAGGEHQFASDVINSSAANTIGWFVSPILRTANYTVGTVVVDGKNTAKSYAVDGKTSVKVGEFTVKAVDKDVLFKGANVYNKGTAKNEYLTGLAIYRGTDLVSTSASFNGRNIVFGSKGDLIKKWQTATYSIKAAITDADRLTDKYEFEIRKTEDVNIVEDATSYSVKITSGIPATVGTISIQGADIRFTSTTKPLNKTVAPGATDVEIYSGTVVSKAGVSLENLQLVATSTISGLDEQIDNVYLQVGNQLIAGSISSTGLASLVEFEGAIILNANQTYPVRVYANVKSDALGTFRFTTEIRVSEFKGIKEYLSSEETVLASIGSIDGSNITISQPKLNVTVTNRTDKKVAEGEKNVVLANVELSTTTDTPIEVSSLKFEATGSDLSHFYDEYVTLVNADVNDVELKGADLEFDLSTALIVKKGSPIKLTVILNKVSTDVVNGDNLQLKLTNVTAVETTNTKDLIVTPNILANKITVADAQITISASSSPVLKTLFAINSADQKIMSFRVKAENDSVKLDKAEFTGLKIDKLSNYRLSTDGTTGGVFASNPEVTTTGIKFSDVKDTAPEIAKDQNVTYFLIADANDADGESVSIYLDGLTVEASNGNAVTKTGSNLTISHSIAKGVPVFAKVNTTDAFTIKFSVTAQWTEDVKLNSLDISNTLNGYGVTGASLKVYKENTMASSVAATTGNVNGGVIALTGNNIVDAGTTVTYIIVIENTIGIEGDSKDRNMNLNDINFGTNISAKDYSNVGGQTLPFKAAK